MEIVFEREALFAEVWASPVSTLAKKYGLSDNSLRKICKTLDIPLPVRGHWARVAAGHQIKAPALPPNKGTAQSVQREVAPGAVENSMLAVNDPRLMKSLASKTAAANFINVDAVLTSPHALVKAAAKRVNELINALEKSRARINAPKAPKLKTWEPDFSRLSGPHWENYVDKGCVMDLPEDVLPMRVSIEASDRALRIWDALIKACVARKMKVSIAPRRLNVEYEHESAELRLSERLFQTPERKGIYPSIKRRPTGELRIYVCSLGAERKFSDTENVPLEEQLNDVLQDIYRTIAAAKVRTANRIEKRKAHAIAEDGRRLELAQQQEIQRQAEAEKRRQESLIAEAGAWAQAEAIRAYSANIMKTANVDNVPINDELRDWLAWSADVADQLDPTKKRIG
jgi:hypothetical protein